MYRSLVALNIDNARLAGLSDKHRNMAEQALLEVEAALADNPLLRYNNPMFGPTHSRQLLFHRSDARTKVFLGGNQSGKAQPTDEPVLTPTGWKPIGDLLPGDHVFAGDGTVTTVTNIFPQGTQPVFKLTFDDGASTRCCENHLWRIQDRGARFRKQSKRYGTWTVKSLRAIREQNGDNPHPVARPAIQTVIPQFESKPLPVDPYLLGLLIGDGNLTAGVRFSTADLELVGYIANTIPQGMSIKHVAAYDYGITNGNCGGKPNPLLEHLRDLGLAGKRSEHKFIPSQYLYADPASRLALLQGLMDTDGHIGMNAHMEFATSSPRLADDFTELVRLLGGKATVRWRNTTNLPSARIHVRLPGVDCFRLPRKAERRKDPVSTTSLRVLHRIEPAGNEQCVCIQVNHPEHTYITKDGIVTHNTSAGIVDDIIQAIDKNMVPDHLQQYKRFTPPFRCRIAAQGREEIEDFIFEKIREWCPVSQLVGGSFKTAYDRQHHVLHFKNGSYFSFKTYAQEGQQWGGSTLDRVHMDEEPGREHLAEARLRVMRRKGDLLFTMTPVNGLTYLYDVLEPAFIDAEKNDGVGQVDGMFLVTVDMDDNPWLDEDSKKQALQGLSREEKLARKEGKFVALTGLIYPEFTQETHVVPNLSKLPDNVNVIVGIDPGIRYACAVGWFYMTPDDRMVMFDEGYFKDLTISQVAEQIHRTNGFWGCDPLYYVIDPAARNRASQTGRSDQDAFSENGIVTILGQNDVKAGINRCKERLQTNRFFVAEGCVNFQKEIRTYRWKKPPRNSENDGRETPVKKDDHLLDQWRLVCMSRPYGPTVDVPDNETENERMLREHWQQITATPASVA